MKAAVMRALRTPLTIEEIQISKPGPREVLVRTVATGVCHSDLHVVEGESSSSRCPRSSSTRLEFRRQV